MTQHSRSLQAPWLSHYEQGVPATIDYEETCLPGFLEQTAAHYPERTALVFQGYRITFRQLNAMVDIDKREPNEVAEEWLRDQGLID